MENLLDLLGRLIAEKGGNQSEIARKLEISPQRLGQYLQGRQAPKLDFFEAWERVYGEDIPQMLKTNVYKIDPNPMDMTDPGDVYRKLIEDNKDYRLLPTLILEKYSIVPNIILEDNRATVNVMRDQQDKQDKLINKYEELISELEREKKDLETQNKDLLKKVSTLESQLSKGAKK